MVVYNGEKCRYVMVGNHRDAWGFGALDPGSGTAQMMEVRKGDLSSKEQLLIHVIVCRLFVFLEKRGEVVGARRGAWSSSAGALKSTVSVGPGMYCNPPQYVGLVQQKLPALLNGRHTWSS